MAITTTCELRRAAAEVIRQRGWAQWTAEDRQSGAVCLIGALAYALGGTADTRLDAVARAALAEIGFSGLLSVYAALSWNDSLSADTGAARVIARLLHGCEEA